MPDMRCYYHHMARYHIRCHAFAVYTYRYAYISLRFLPLIYYDADYFRHADHMAHERYAAAAYAAAADC